MAFKRQWPFWGKAADIVHRDVGYKLLTEWLTGQQDGQDIPTNLRDILRHYRSWVYVATEKNATTLASLPLRLYAGSRARGEKWMRQYARVDRARERVLRASPVLTKATSDAEEIVEITEHPFLDLMANVNERMNGFDALELTQKFLELTGVSFWYVERSGLNAPERFWILPSQLVAVKHDKAGMPVDYVIGNPPDDIHYKPEEIIHFMCVSPLSTLAGYGPGHAAFGAVVRQRSIETLESAMFKNRALPGAILSPKEPMTEPQIAQLAEQFKKFKGPENAGKTFIPPIPLEVQKSGISAAELAKLADPGILKEEILAVFGIPMTKTELNKADASAVQGDVTYLRDAILPRVRRMEGKLNERLIPMYGEQRPGVRLFCAFDNPVPPDREYGLRRAQVLVASSGVAYVNEVRASLDLEPDPARDGELHERPEPILAPPTETEESRGVSAPSVVVKRVEDRGLRVTLRKLFAAQRSAVLASIVAKSAKAQTPTFDMGEWVERFAKDSRPHLEKDLLRGAKAGANAIHAEFAWDLEQPEVAEFVRGYTYRFARAVNDTTQAALRDVFLTAFDEGQTVQEMAEAVNGVFDYSERTRSLVIARTESSRAVNAGTLEQWRQSDVVQGSYWQAEIDCCPFCRVMADRYGEGKTLIPLGGLFAQQGSVIETDEGRMVLDYSPVVSPPLHPNCRCALIAKLKEE